MKKFNKKGVYLFAIKNLGDEVEVYWDKEYEYDIYYFKSQSIYRDNRLGYMDKPDSKTEFFVETVKGLVPKELKNAKYMVEETGEEIEYEEFIANAPISFDKSKFYCIVIEVEHIDSLLFNLHEYRQKIYEFETETNQKDFAIHGKKVGKLIEDKTRILRHIESEDVSNVIYLVSSGTKTKEFKKEYLLNEDVFDVTGDINRVIFYPSLDTYVFNCHEDYIFEAIDNLSKFTLDDFDSDKFIEEVKSWADDCNNFTCKYIGKAVELNPSNRHCNFDNETIYFVNTFLKLDIIWTQEECDAINQVINNMK